MKQNYLIGLGGSGGKVITRLYERLLGEHGPDFADQVACIAIDTDQDELNDLARLGVEKVCISGSETVGQIYAQLGEDVGEWCPNTANEGVFFSSPVFNGASQCRLKSRLCFANFLRNSNNQLAQALEDSLKVSSTGETTDDAPPTVLIVSSIAGGTGSGIFIQTALYVKKFFKQYNVEPIVHGLFACPDLYKNVVPQQQLPNLYANAYAVIRELNAFNMICGNYEVSEEGTTDIDMEISSSCEGRLFKKDASGRYGDKPYDLMYFIDKVNSLNRILGGLEEYYEAMANIAYSHLYTDIKGEVMSAESNELKARTKVPTAIYGSAGAATMRYPYEDMLHYFASRSIKDGVSEIWSVIDNQWNNYVREKDMAERSRGRLGYTPSAEDRAAQYIDVFEKEANTNGIHVTPLTFLGGETKKTVGNNERSRVDMLKTAIRREIKDILQDDKRFVKCREVLGLADLAGAKGKSQQEFNAYLKATDDKKREPFGKVRNLDDALDDYCVKGLQLLLDNAVALANAIFCTDKNMWDTYDKKSCNVVSNLLYDETTNTWTHPIAARYMLYAFKKMVDEELEKAKKTAMVTSANSANDYLAYLLNGFVAGHRLVLDNSDQKKHSNTDMMTTVLSKKKFGYKKDIAAMLDDYYKSLEKTMHKIHKAYEDIFLALAYESISGKLQALIEEYELFFDKIDEFKNHAESAQIRYATMHDKAKGDIFVCASEPVKEALYDELRHNLNTQTGPIASRIGEALFRAMRDKSVARAEKKGKKLSVKEQSKGVEALFTEVENIVADGARELTAIQGELDMNVFQAILCEYRILNPDNAGDEAVYATNAAARVNINAFVGEKLSGLSKMAAPMLVFDSRDSYRGMMDEGATVERRVTNAYRFLSHNAAVDESIRKLIGASDRDGGAVAAFYNEQADVLPKDTEGQTITINYTKSDEVDSYSVLCYATAHCLQPYQIKAFDELHGGVYYEYYARAIADMEEVQRYSMTPHLDKRWHKHGVLPYINVRKEEECRTDLAKAFLFALCYGKFASENVNGRDYVIFQDEKLGRTAERIYYKGYPVLREQINRAVYWFSDQEALIERYAVLFDQKVETDLEKMMAASETIKAYESNVSGHSALFGQMWRNILRASKVNRRKDGSLVDVSTMTDDQRKKYEEKREKLKISVLDLAYRIHMSEETEIDRDYGELIVEMLCEMIKKYAKRPFNAKDIEKENKSSVAYADYLHVLNHFAGKFLTEYAKKLDPSMKDTLKKEKKKNETKKENNNAENKNDVPATAAQTLSESVDGEEDLVETADDVIQTKSVLDAEASAAAKSHPGYQWAFGELSRYIGE